MVRVAVSAADLRGPDRQGGCPPPHGPRSVVDAYVFTSEQVGECEPRGAGAATDRAVRDPFVVVGQADRRESLGEFGGASEPPRPVVQVVDRDVHRRGNMSGTTAWFGVPMLYTQVSGA